MKFWEFVLPLPPDQYICWVDHTLPDYKTVYKNGEAVRKRVDPFTKPMKVGNITVERIGCMNNLYKKDIHGIKSFTEWRGRKYPNGVIFFHVDDLERLKIYLGVNDVMQIYEKRSEA